MTETRTRYAVPALAIEEPTAELSLDLLAVTGGALTFRTNATTVIDLLRDGIGDLTDGDLTRIAELYHAVLNEVRQRSQP